MDITTKWFYKFTKFHTFQQELTSEGQNYYFSVSLKKLCLFLASSAILALGFFLGLIIHFVITYSNILQWSPVLIFLNGWVLGLLFAVFLLCLMYIVFLIVMTSRMIRLHKFTLTLKEGEVSVCEKPLAIPEKLAMRIIVRSSHLQNIAAKRDLGTTLMFEPLSLSPFYQLSKAQKYLSYHEKRRLAEQLSLNLKIQFIDMLSSFEPGIYENSQNLAERLKFTTFKPSGNLKFATSKNITKNVHNIQLPYEKKTIFFMIVPPIPLMLALSISYFTQLFSSSATQTNLSFIPFNIILYFTIYFLITLRMPIRSKIVVSDDSISMIRQNIWGTRKTFHSILSELKDISIVRERNKPSRIVFRSDKLTRMTGKNPKETVTDATMIINNLLVTRL